MNNEQTEQQTESSYMNPYLLPPPPPPRITRKRAPAFVFVLLLLLAFALGYGLATVLTPAASSSLPPLTASITPTATSQPVTNYSVTDLLDDFEQAGCNCSYGLTYSPTIWDWSSQRLFISVHSLTSASWEDPAQSTDASLLGLWVYRSSADASSAFSQVYQDEVAPTSQIPHSNYVREYVHGRCLFLAQLGATRTWSGYDHVLGSNCL